MIDAYKIGISLLVDTNANSEIGGMIRTFKQLDGAVVGASDAVKNLNAALRETGRLAGGISRAAKAMDGVANAARGVSGDMSGAAREAGAFADAMQRAADASKAIVPAPRLLGYDGGSGGGGMVPAPRLLGYDGGGGSGGGGMVPAPRLLGYDGGGGSGGGGGYSGPRRIGGPGGMPLLGYSGGAGGLSAPPGGGGIGGIGGGSGGLGGRPLPIPPGGGGSGGGGALIEAAAIKSAMAEELALTSTLSTLGYKPGTPEWDAAYGSLRNLAGTSAEGTIFSGAATAGFMPTAAGVSMFHGNTPDERSAAMAKFQAIFPTLLRFGETAQQSGLGSADDSTAAGFGFAHMLNRYDPKDLVPALDLLFNLSRVTHSTITQEQNALKYGVPAAKAAGMSPEDAAMMTGFIQLMGFRGTTAGTGVSNVINSIHNYDPDRNGDFSAAARALQGMGILDADGKVVDGVAPGGHLNFGALIAKIAEYAKHQRPIDAMKGLKEAFNSRGERIAGTFEDPEAIGRLDTFTTDVKTLPGVSETQQTLAGTTGQQGQQVIARFADLLNGLVSPTLPALRLGFEGLHDTISVVKERLDASPEGEASLGTAALAASSGMLFKSIVRIAGQNGMKLIPAAADGALVGAAAVLGEIALGAAVFSIAAYLKSQLQSVSDRIEGAIFGNDPKTAADRKAFKDFSPFDRSTWADPNAHWWQATPKRAAGSDGPVPVYLTNPHDVGDHIERGLSGAVNAPPTGPTQFDTRLGVLQPGMAVVP